MDLQTAIENYLRRHNLAALDPRAVLFDMDGVLYDSMPFHAISWEQTVSELGIPCTRDEFYLYEGQTGRQTISQMFERGFGRPSTDEENRRVYHRKTELFNACGQAPVMPGAAEALSLTKQAGLEPVLVTGSGQASLLDKLEHNFPGIFRTDRMVTAHDVVNGKPAPEPYLRGLCKVGLRPEQAVVVENAPLGCRAASSAGIFTIAVNTGPMPDKVLYDEGADIVLADMQELAARFDEILHTLRTCKPSSSPTA